MKKSLSVVLLAAAALLGGCAGKSDTDVNAPISTETRAVTGADCSKLNGLSVKPAKYQSTGDAAGWSHLTFRDGVIVSTPNPGMPALTQYSCLSSNLNGFMLDFVLKTNIGQVEVSYRPSPLEPTLITWTNNTPGASETNVQNAYIKG